MAYITGKIYGLPKPLKTRTKESRKKEAGTQHVYSVVIGVTKYYKVHFKRQDISKIKYFRKKTDALMFREMLRLNKYL